MGDADHLRTLKLSSGVDNAVDRHNSDLVKHDLRVLERALLEPVLDRN